MLRAFCSTQSVHPFLTLPMTCSRIRAAEAITHEYFSTVSDALRSHAEVVQYKQEVRAQAAARATGDVVLAGSSNPPLRLSSSSLRWPAATTVSPSGFKRPRASFGERSTAAMIHAALL